MKNLDYKKNIKFIGCSDVASLILRFGSKIELLHFGEDGIYYIYYVDDLNVKIPEHYHLIYTTHHWLKVYDDKSLTFDESGDFEIYRAGDFGCIFRKIK